MSWPMTLADWPELMRALAVHPDNFDPTVAHTRVWAPCCARQTPADTIVSLVGLRTEIRGGNILPKRDVDWACDGCIHLLILDESNGWTWSNLFAALGAPADVVRYHVAREVEVDARRAANKTDEELARQGKERLGVQPQEVFEQAMEHLPADLTNDPATMRPDV